MITEMYTMYDSAACEYNNPIFFRNRDVAIATIVRELRMVMENGSDFQKVVAPDMEFYFIGFFDTDTAEITFYEPELVLSGKEYFEKNYGGEDDGQE